MLVPDSVPGIHPPGHRHRRDFWRLACRAYVIHERVRRTVFTSPFSRSAFAKDMFGPKESNAGLPELLPDAMRYCAASATLPLRSATSPETSNLTVWGGWNISPPLGLYQRAGDKAGCQKNNSYLLICRQ